MTHIFVADRRAKIAFGLLLTAAAIPKAFAFYEDICYLPNHAGIDSCMVLPSTCGLTEPVTQQCKNDALLAFLNVHNPNRFDQNIPGRSTIHVDITHILAQAVGFSADDAYWIAAYDEVTDLGTFQPRDAQGNPLGDAAQYTTVTLDGMERNNQANGGVYFHFNAPGDTDASGPPQTVNGLKPDVNDPSTEPFIGHIRRWAMYTQAPECSGSLTVQSQSPDGDYNYSTGDSCYLQSSGLPGTLLGDLSAIAAATVVFPALPSGPQVIVTGNTTGGDPITSQHFDAEVGTYAADARLGVYLHVLADRISHHVCTDQSELTGPNNSGEFHEDMDNPDCVQTLHVLRHQYETGVNFSRLSPQDQTTTAALQAVFSELKVFAKQRGIYNSRADDASFQQMLMKGLTNALESPSATTRVNQLATVACNLQLQPFPGSPSCALQR